jgi:hypothetical protein
MSSEPPILPGPSSDAQPPLPGLLPLYPWAKDALPLANGKLRSKRSVQLVVQRYGLERAIVRVGHLAWIDPELAVQILRGQLVKKWQPRKPGRPPRAA